MEDHSLEVLPVLQDPNRPNYRETHENILSPPFRMALVGSSKSGKSNLLMNYLRPCFYGGSKREKVKGCFDRIIVFSPNLGLDSTTRHLKDLTDDIYTTYNDNMIASLIDTQKMNEGSSRQKVLIIADDLLAMNARPESMLFTSSSYLRHLDCSIIYITQTYQSRGSLPPVVRNNIDGLVFFKCPSHKQVHALCEDLQGTFGSKENVMNMLGYATMKPYHFCFFNYRDLSVFHNHTEKMWQKYNEDGSYAEEFKGFDADTTDEEDE